MRTATARPASSAWATAMGWTAVVAWSTSVAVARSLTEELGTVTAAAAIYLGGGLLSCGVLALRSGVRPLLARSPRRYVLVCGALFCGYTVLLYAAIGLAADRVQTVVVGLINYLWPVLTLALAVPILKRRARWTLLPGLLLAFGGTVLAVCGGRGFSSGPLWAGLAANLPAYTCAAVAAVLWALYSNLSRRLGGGGPGAVPLFLLGTGLLLGAARLLMAEETHWSARAGAELAYMIAVPTLLAYGFWDHGVRRGNFVLVASGSFFIPILATFFMMLYLGAAVGPALWTGSALVTLGALVSRGAFRAAQAEPPGVPDRERART